MRMSSSSSSSRPAVIFLFDCSSARPSLVVRAGRRGRGRELLRAVLPARGGSYRIGYVDGLLLPLRSEFSLYFSPDAGEWHSQLGGS